MEILLQYPIIIVTSISIMILKKWRKINQKNACLLRKDLVSANPKRRKNPVFTWNTGFFVSCW